MTQEERDAFEPFEPTEEDQLIEAYEAGLITEEELKNYGSR